MKTRLLLFLLIALHANMGFAQQKDDAQLTTALDQMMSEYFKNGEPGATAFIARKGEIIYHKAFGTANLEQDIPMAIDNVFRIGSITKQFTAVAILQLMEQGKLSLQDEITKYIPDYPMQGQKITIEHLLTHTSGIPNYTDMEDFEARMPLDFTTTEMIDHFKNEPLEFAPGTKWNYSNSGYYLLGYIVEKVYGETYPQYIEEHFFKALDMKSSQYGSDIHLIKKRVGTYSQGDNGYENAPPLSMTQPYAAGSIQSTVEDLYKWHQALHSYKLLKKETLDKAFTSYKLADGSATHYGYGWSFAFVQDSPSIEHGGGINGTLTMSIYLPREDVFVAVFSNCDCHSPEEVAAKMAAAVIGKSYIFNEAPIEESMLESYTGVYENEKGDQRIITVDGDHLMSQRGRNPKFRIRSYERDKFYFEGALQTMEFSRGKKGKIEKLTTYNRQGNEEWKKTTNPPKAPKEIKLDVQLLDTFIGEYEVVAGFSFVVTREGEKMFVQATGQEKFEIAAEAPTRFFSKINDAEFEFIKDGTGKVIKAILKQGGRETEAKRVV